MRNFRNLARTIPHTLVAAAALAATFAACRTDACTRVLYVAPNGPVITGRSMDWMEDTVPNLWSMPRGVKREGLAGPASIAWTSRYGSLVTSMYELATVDGINEKGLVANVLYLVESDYGTANGKPTLSISLWAQYVLDNYATVAEAVEQLRAEPFRVCSPTLPNGSPGNGHLSISDASGDSAILEYVGGTLVIHHGKEFTVMTNSPTYDEQLALNKYWQSIGGTAFMPGTNRAADRFARASFYLGAIPRQPDPRFIKEVPKQEFRWQALASVLSVVRAVSVPLGISTPGQPNIGTTQWRTAYDNGRRIMYFDNTLSPSTFWVDLDQLDLREGAPIKKLPISGGAMYAGNSTAKFVEAKPFTFISAVPVTK
jgi:choloylglycine hydrolase